MAVTTLTVRKMSDALKPKLNGGDLQTVDATDGGQYANTGVEALIVYNDEAATNTLTFHKKGGVAQTAITLPADDILVFGPLDPEIWGDDVLVKTGDATNVKFSVVALDTARNLITRGRRP